MGKRAKATGETTNVVEMDGSRDETSGSGKGLFRADELPPVPEWARRPPGAAEAGMDRGLFGGGADED